MSYQLHDDLSFCRVDDHLVFLDTRKDRYFRLSNAMERAFLAYMEGGDDQEIDGASLVERNILTVTNGATRCSSVAALESPVRSAMEQAPAIKKIRLTALLNVFAVVLCMRLQLAMRNLGSILTALTAYRTVRAPYPPEMLTETEAKLISDAAAMFWRVRIYVPIKPRCLLDSLAMVKFLAKRGLHANIVFGVTSDPFAAHAWVQVADLVLSDTVGHVTAHTPIRVA